jgi:anti-sigma factor ChrR (cupin superfamily)
MSAAAGGHAEQWAELVSLYALGSLPADEVDAVEAHLASCPDCREELRSLGPIVNGFDAWPTDVLRPSTGLGHRLAERIAAETGGTAMVPEAPHGAEPEWNEVAPGIACKLLATDTEKDRVSMLVRLAPGTDYPPHRHAGVEELYMLDGVLIVDDQTFYPGDYRRGEAGSVDRRVWSETGCTCVLITSVRDALM